MQQLEMELKRPRRAADVARERADTGIARAVLATEKREPGWCEKACDVLRDFAVASNGPFTVEHARAAIEKKLPEPNDLRTWGRVTRMAAARGYIERVPDMYFPAASSNGSPKPVYRRGPAA